jgi:REP element-mobilizing transposase RayT
LPLTTEQSKVVRPGHQAGAFLFIIRAVALGFDSKNYHRRSLRLKSWDYASPGAYFVTIVTHFHTCRFGEIVDDTLQLNLAGEMIATAWEALPTRFPNIELDEWIVMPNHLHGIVMITDSNVGAPLVGAQSPDNSTIWAGTSPAPTLGAVIGAFKSMTTNEYIRGVRELGWSPFIKRLWQRNYYEHIIRNDHELGATRDYIFNNPLQWALDHDNLVNISASISDGD